MELLRVISIELVGACLAGLVVIQLVFEVRKHRHGSAEKPPRVISLDGDLGGLWSDGGDLAKGAAAPPSEAVSGS